MMNLFNGIILIGGTIGFVGLLLLFPIPMITFSIIIYCLDRLF